LQQDRQFPSVTAAETSYKIWHSKWLSTAPIKNNATLT
jgi:hypothetical protein